MSTTNNHIYDCECFHMPEKSDNFKKTVAEFHNRPLTQKHLKPHYHVKKRDTSNSVLASLHAR